MSKRQILMVHGGMTFRSEKDYLHWLKTKKISTKKKPYWEADLEQKLAKKALSVYIVCAPFDGDLPTEDLVGGFKLKSNLSLLERNCKNLYTIFSKDDEVVPVSHAEKYRKRLKTAHIIIYKSKGGHFTIPKFPEIIKMIQLDVQGWPGKNSS